MIFNTAGSSAFRCSGDYIIQAKGGALTDWTNVSGLISGPTTGSILSDGDNNPQTIDENVLIPGQTYSFRMVDDNNSIKSQLVNITIPVNAVIQSYSAGISPITFTPDGSDGWNLDVVANPATPPQIPIGTTIDSVYVEINFVVAGSGNQISSNTYTADDTINTGPNGAGLYDILLRYNVSDGSFFEVGGLYVVDSTDNILHYFAKNGATVNSSSGLTMNVTADISQSGTLPISWIAFNGSSFTNIGTGPTATLTLPSDCVGLLVSVTLDSNFSDYSSPDYATGFTLTIN